MVYHGRFVFPAPLDLGKNPFFHCQLRKDQRTAEVKQLPAREMRRLEKLLVPARVYLQDGQTPRS